MTESRFVQGMVDVFNAQDYKRRTVVPGVLDSTPETGAREQKANFQPGIADLQGTEAAPAAITPDAPMLNLTSGGFYFLMPASNGDEALGLVCDRASGPWVSTRIPNGVDQTNGKRSKDLSDVMLTPFAITAPSGAPGQWTGMVIGGPAGEALELSTAGEVTITKQGTPVATITMGAAGSVTIEVAGGQSVNIGGAAAVALAKAQALIDAIDAAWAAATPVANDGGASLKSTWLATWNTDKGTIPAQKAKGE